MSTSEMLVLDFLNVVGGDGGVGESGDEGSGDQVGKEQ